MKDLRLALLAALVASLGLAACGGDDDTSNMMPDAIRRDGGPDAPRPPDGGSPPDGGMATCTIGANLMDISGALMQTEAGVTPLDPMMPAAGNYTYFFAVLNNDMKPDIFNTELYDGYGAFDGMMGRPTSPQMVTFPHSYTVPADDPPAMGGAYDYRSCGVCVTIFGDLDPMNMFRAAQGYVMTSGTVNVAVLNATTFQATVTGAMMEEIVIGQPQGSMPANGTIKAGGCRSQITTATFTQPICGVSGNPCCAGNPPTCNMGLTCMDPMGAATCM